MSIRKDVQDALKEAMKNRDQIRLDCVRMMKGALLTKEKESGDQVGDAAAVTVLRSEIRKRQQSLEVLTELGKAEEAAAAKNEIAIIEEFLPAQLDAAQLEEKVRAYLAEHPEITHAGKLTGALKKELGDAADGKVLNEICRKVLDA
jgi:uncharacterized protein